MKNPRFGSVIQIDSNISTTSSSIKAHTHLDIVQFRMACLQPSTPAPQILHAADSDIFLLLGTVAVGIEFRAKRQIKILILGGMFKSHNFFQYFFY